MTTKLTLSVDKRVVQRAKVFARSHKQSLSQIVTSYLDHISSQVADAEDIDPEVMELSDCIRVKDLPKIQDSKYQYLKEKYIHD
jgi:cell division protein FtsL